jgi:tetratricopeptide (TPR) repeat protein
MKTRKTQSPAKASPGFSLKPWHVAVGVLVALLVLFEVYGPALNGVFVFDDESLPFYSRDFGARPLIPAITGVRPFLMFTFWLNHQISGLEPYGYHLLNFLFHFASGVLVFFICRKVLEWAGVAGARRELLAAFAGCLFLFHPIQTESVAYIASRSENLSILFCYAAFALFLYRQAQAVSWPVVAGVLVLFAAAASTKEHTIVLPAVLLLTDYYWNPGFSFEGARKNWRLYGTMAVVGAAGVYSVWNLLRTAPTAGFGVKDLPWNHYLYTQWRALWIYFRLLVFPAGQNADYRYPVSHTPFEPGTLIGLAGLLVLVGLAIRFQHRLPLASYGFLAALLLFAPTSSVIPIRDVVAERRVYLPMIGLLFVALEFLRRWKLDLRRMAAVLTAILLVCAVLTYQRNKVWAGPVPLWEDVLAKSPENSRAHFQLALGYYEDGRCQESVRHYKTAERLGEREHRLYVDWALADDCLGRFDDALAKIKRAIEIEKTAHAYALMGMIYAKQNRRDEAMAALDEAGRIDAGYDMTYAYRGNLLVLANDFAGAAAQYRHALDLDPNNQLARNGLARVQAALGGTR